MKVCSICKGDPQPLSHFNKNATRKDGHQSHCRECGKTHAKGYYRDHKATMVPMIVAKTKDRVQKNRERLAEYLKTHPCVDCGESDIVVLDLDHVRGNKTNDVTHMFSHSWETIQREIQKCDVRCANCHRRKSAKQLGHFRATYIPGSSNGRAAGSDSAYRGSIPLPGTE